MLSVYVADKVMNYDIIWDDSIHPGFFRLKDAKKEFSDMSGLVQHYKQTAVKLLFIYLFICLNNLQLQLETTVKKKQFTEYASMHYNLHITY